MTDNAFIRAGLSRLTTLRDLLIHFSKGRKIILIPLVIIFLLTAALLILAGGLSYVAPFVYSIF